MEGVWGGSATGALQKLCLFWLGTEGHLLTSEHLLSQLCLSILGSLAQGRKERMDFGLGSIQHLCAILDFQGVLL